MGLPTGKKTTIVWTEGLRKRFREIVQMLGVDNATPKKILEHMKVKDLTRDHVSSHLQKYRLSLKKSANKKCSCVQTASNPTEGHSMQGMNNNLHGTTTGVVNSLHSSSSRLLPNHDVFHHDRDAFSTEERPCDNSGIGSSSGVNLNTELTMSWDRKSQTNIEISVSPHPSNQGVNGQSIQDIASYDANKNEEVQCINQHQIPNGYLPGSHPSPAQHCIPEQLMGPIWSPDPLEGNMTYLGLLMNSDDEV